MCYGNKTAGLPYAGNPAIFCGKSPRLPLLTCDLFVLSGYRLMHIAELLNITNATLGQQKVTLGFRATQDFVDRLWAIRALALDLGIDSWTDTYFFQ